MPHARSRRFFLESWQPLLTALVCATSACQNDARVDALLCYALNNGELHRLPTALGAGSVVERTLAMRYSGVALARCASPTRSTLCLWTLGSSCFSPLTDAMVCVGVGRS